MTMGWNGGLDDGWRQYESGFHNCIFYNSLLRNNNPYDDDELDDLTDYLGGLYVLPNAILSEYFNRCERLISKMDELGVNTDANWNDIDTNMVSKIRTNIKERNTANLVNDVRSCISELESKYGVEE
jgi:hypothetical protein|tara:strand:+ start:767 stop:1147 length:381 start_codon:yes stop_codon:yes gene_type:complete